MGIATSGSGDNLLYAATNTEIPSLAGATRRVVIRYSNGTLQVSIDGTLYLSQAVTVPPMAIVGWTAGTGGSTDRHLVRNVTFSYT